jgi:hypothetical protein
MTAHKPPIPPEQKSPHATSGKAGKELPDKPDKDQNARGRRDNLTENTTNKGHQQDR